MGAMYYGRTNSLKFRLGKFSLSFRVPDEGDCHLHPEAFEITIAISIAARQKGMRGSYGPGLEVAHIHQFSHLLSVGLSHMAASD